MNVSNIFEGVGHGHSLRFSDGSVCAKKLSTDLNQITWKGKSFMKEKVIKFWV